MFKQIDKGEWNSLYDAEPLCTLPFSVSEIEEMHDVKFFEYVEEGLGTVFGAFCIIDSHLLFLNGYGTKDDKSIGIAIEVQGNNTDPENTVQKISSVFKVQPNWVREDLSIPKWKLLRQGDDGNEVEITRFHRRELAEYVMKKFTDRGHKQIYFIRENA